MAIPFLNNINLDDNQLLNAKLHVTASAPATEKGQIYFDSTQTPDVIDTAKYYANTTDTWVSLKEYSFPAVAKVNGYITSTITGTTAKPIVKFNLNATGTADSTTYLRGDNQWEPISAIPGTYTWTASDGANSEAIVSYDTVTWSGTGTTTVTYATASNTFTINSADQYTGTVESVGLSMPAAFAVADSPVTSSGTLTVTGAGTTTEYIDGTGALQTFPTTDNYQYWTLSDGSSSTNITSTGVATFQGTADEVEVAEASGTVTIGLPDNVTIGGNLTVTTALNMTNGQINNLANGTASTDAVNLGQVQGLIAGTGQFQGGYDATNDPGSPVISGSSNIALNNGDFYVVTVDGDITFSDQTISVEVGDLIFANTDITANTNPASTAYTFVIQDQNIAGEGASDAATEKGVAGFNSAHFSVTANGFVSADIYGGGSALGIVPSGGAATTFLRGDGTWADPNSANTYAATITDSVSGTTFDHGLGDDVIVQLYDAATKETVYADVERNGDYLNITFASTPTNSVRVLVQKIG